MRIDGPAVHWASYSQRHMDEWDAPSERRRDGGPRLLECVKADGHRVVLGLGELPWKNQLRLIGWLTLGLLLLITPWRMATCAACCAR